MSNRNAPCLDCLKRAVGCHAECTEGYLEYAQANAKRRERVGRIADANAQAEAIKYRARKKMTHYMRGCT
jgi:hypothetical protein